MIVRPNSMGLGTLILFIALSMQSCRSTDSGSSDVEAARGTPGDQGHCKELENSGDPAKMLFTCKPIDRTSGGVTAGVFQAGNIFGVNYRILPGALPPGVSVPPAEPRSTCGTVKTNTEQLFDMKFTTTPGTLKITKLSGDSYKGEILFGKSGRPEELSCVKGFALPNWSGSTSSNLSKHAPRQKLRRNFLLARFFE